MMKTTPKSRVRQPQQNLQKMLLATIEAIEHYATGSKDPILKAHLAVAQKGRQALAKSGFTVPPPKPAPAALVIAVDEGIGQDYTVVQYSKDGWRPSA